MNHNQFHHLTHMEQQRREALARYERHHRHLPHLPPAPRFILPLTFLISVVCAVFFLTVFPNL